jgi:hypothetical protein
MKRTRSKSNNSLIRTIPIDSMNNNTGFELDIPISSGQPMWKFDFDKPNVKKYKELHKAQDEWIEALNNTQGETGVDTEEQMKKHFEEYLKRRKDHKALRQFKLLNNNKLK